LLDSLLQEILLKEIFENGIRSQGKKQKWGEKKP